MGKVAFWLSVNELVEKLDKSGRCDPRVMEELKLVIAANKPFSIKREEASMARLRRISANGLTKDRLMRLIQEANDKPKDEESDIFSNATTEQERLEAIKRLMSE